MKNLILISLLTLALFSGKGIAESNKTSITIVIPSVEQEASSVWRTINDVLFFEQQGYQIALPKHEVIERLLQKSRNGEFGPDDFPTIYNLIETEIYERSDYQSAYDKIKSDKPLINRMVDELNRQKKKWQWDFKSFEEYKVVLTLYGSGGSYDPDNGIVTLFTTPKGEFKKYKKPANTIIHEIVHIGIEESIVQKFQLSHGTKERIVDHVVLLMFGDLLPNYRLQNMGDNRFDKHLQTKEDVSQLSSIIEESRYN